MLDQARRNCELHAIQNVQFIHANDLSALELGSFDLVHSFIVFQHIPVARGEHILKNLISLIADGGIGAIHLTYSDSRSALRNVILAIRRRSSLAHGVMNVIQGGQFSRPLMQMNRYSVNRLLDLLLESGCSNIHVELSNDNDFHAAMLYFEKSAQARL
jgi:hypothetical protein